MSDYVLLPRIDIQNANAHSAYWLLNGPPITAAIAYAHALGLAEDFAEEIKSVALVHHNCELQADVIGNDHLLQQRRGATYINKKDYAGSAKVPSLSLQPTASRHMTISILIEVDEDAVEQESLVKSKFLRRARFNGGQIISYGKPVVCESLGSINKYIPRGFWVADRHDLVSSSNLEPTQAILQYLSPKGNVIREVLIRDLQNLNQGDKYRGLVTTLIEKVNAAEYSPIHVLDRSLQHIKSNNELFTEVKKILSQYTWLSATTLGYSLLTPAEHREYARENKPHAFAEPMVGLVQYISTRTALSPKQFFWKDSWVDSNTYIISQAS